MNSPEKTNDDLFMESCGENRRKRRKHDDNNNDCSSNDGDDNSKIKNNEKCVESHNYNSNNNINNADNNNNNVSNISNNADIVDNADKADKADNADNADIPSAEQQPAKRGRLLPSKRPIMVFQPAGVTPGGIEYTDTPVTFYPLKVVEKFCKAYMLDNMCDMFVIDEGVLVLRYHIGRLGTVTHMISPHVDFDAPVADPKLPELDFTNDEGNCDDEAMSEDNDADDAYCVTRDDATLMERVDCTGDDLHDIEAQVSNDDDDDGCGGVVDDY